MFRVFVGWEYVYFFYNRVVVEFVGLGLRKCRVRVVVIEAGGSRGFQAQSPRALK